MWVTEGKLPQWDTAGPWVTGFSNPVADEAAAPGNWADEMDGVPAAGITPCARVEEHYNAMRKVLEYNKRERPARTAMR